MHLSPTAEQMNATLEQLEADRLADLERSEQLGRELERALGVADVVALPRKPIALVLVRNGRVMWRLPETVEPWADELAEAHGADLYECPHEVDNDELQAFLDAQPRFELVREPEPANDNVVPLFRSKPA